MSDLAIREARATESDVRGIYDLLLHMFDEGPMQPLDPMKAMIEINRVCEREAAWIVEDGERIVASAGLVQGGFWYSEAPALITRWLYAVPEHRGADGAWGMMLDEIRALGTAIDMTAWLDVFNPAKTRKPGRLEGGFSRFSFEPRGRRMRLTPAETEAA